VEGQINELTKLGFTADPECIKHIAGGKFTFIFCCAEQCLSDEFQSKSTRRHFSMPALFGSSKRFSVEKRF